MTTDTPLRYTTVVYEITDETEWRKTNPLNYAHNGLSAVRVRIHDACEKLEKAEAEVVGLRNAFSHLTDEIECSPKCSSHQADHCDCGRIERAYAISASIPNVKRIAEERNKAEAEVERLTKQLKNYTNAIETL